MNIFFWQNTNSIHQAAFFRQLGKYKNHNVTLIITENLSSHRKEMGWNEPELPEVSVLKFSDISNWKSIIDENCDNNSIHIFSGISAYKNVFKAFKYAHKRKCRMGILSEPLNLSGFKGIIKNIRARYYNILYSKSINLILAIGSQAPDQFISWGYAKQIIFPWIYTIEPFNESLISNDTSSKFKLLFVGSFIKRKGCDILIDALKLINTQDLQTDFYSLNEKNKAQLLDIKADSNLGNQVNFFPFLDNQEMRKRMANYDYLILPSRFDGWGAVVSESLFAGVPVILTNDCGASTLVNSDTNLGVVIQELSSDNLSTELRALISIGKTGYDRRLYISNWANNHISPIVICEYFLKIIEFINTDVSSDRPTPPWS